MSAHEGSLDMVKTGAGSVIGGSTSWDTLKEAIIAFLTDYSIEATPHGEREIESYPEFLDPGTTVYVAHPPNTSVDEVVDLAVRLARRGYRPVPHIVARKLQDRAQLDAALGRLGDAGVDRALVVAGDPPKPAGSYASSMQVLATGLLARHGFKRIAVAGHPEGNRKIGPTMLQQALAEKCDLAARDGLDMYIVTQFGFDAHAVLDWETATTREGIPLPIHAGMAGRAPLKDLLKYAMRCGIGGSMRMLVSHTSAMSEKIKLTPPDELITAFASHRAMDPTTRIERAHFFAFGGVGHTARWLNAVLAGHFSLDETGSRIELT